MHGSTLGSAIAATRRDAAVLLLDPLAQAASLRLCLRGPGFDLSQFRVHQGLLCQGPRASMRLDPDRGMGSPQLLLRTREPDLHMALGPGGARPRHGHLRTGQGCVRHGRLSASDKRHQDQHARNQASRKTLLRSLVSHDVRSPPPMRAG
jgi:hypothetical protein